MTMALEFQVNSFSSHHGKIDYGISSISRDHQFRDSHHLLLRESSFYRFCPAVSLSSFPLCSGEAACEDFPRTPVPLAFQQQQSPHRRARARERGQANYSPGSLLAGLPCAACGPRPKIMVLHSQTFFFQVPAINPSSLLFSLGLVTMLLLQPWISTVFPTLCPEICK